MLDWLLTQTLKCLLPLWPKRWLDLICSLNSTFNEIVFSALTYTCISKHTIYIQNRFTYPNMWVCFRFTMPWLVWVLKSILFPIVPLTFLLLIGWHICSDLTTRLGSKCACIAVSVYSLKISSYPKIYDSLL